MSTVFQVRAEKRLPSGEWVPFHSSERFEDTTPFQRKVKETAEGIKGLLLKLGDLKWRTVQIEDEGEIFDVRRLFTRDGEPARLQIECWPAPADRPAAEDGR